MITYWSKSQYFDIADGTEISKKLALRDYDKVKTIKYYNREQITRHQGTDFGTITIEYWHIVERKRQGRLF